MSDRWMAGHRKEEVWGPGERRFRTNLSASGAHGETKQEHQQRCVVADLKRNQRFSSRRLNRGVLAYRRQTGGLTGVGFCRRGQLRDREGQGTGGHWYWWSTESRPDELVDRGRRQVTGLGGPVRTKYCDSGGLGMH